MNTESKGIYHWKLGDVALARLCQKTYARVRVVKDEKGLFYDDKGISGNEDGSITVTKELCYYVETCRTNHRFWLPYTSLHLAERSRPFYGTEKVSHTNNKVRKTSVSPGKSSTMPHKTKDIKKTDSTEMDSSGKQELTTDIKETEPTEVDSSEEEETKPTEIDSSEEEDIEEAETTEMDSSEEEDIEETEPTEMDSSEEQDMSSSFENEEKSKTKNREIKYDKNFKQFVHRGKEILLDQCFEKLKLNPDKNKDVFNFLCNGNENGGVKFELDKKVTSVSEIEDYWRSCWKYHFANKSFYDSDDEDEDDDDEEEDGDSDNESSPEDPVSIHTTWCIVCGKGDNKREELSDCDTCPAAFHQHCQREWLSTVIYRINAKNEKSEPVQKPKETLVQKILSSTRTKCLVPDINENLLLCDDSEVCPSCKWGPRVGYNGIVWNKLDTCSWWPARVLMPGEVPACLLARSHAPEDLPIKYYGTLNHSWARLRRTCLFLPSHTAVLDDKESHVYEAVMSANDDYISVYLT